MLTPFITGSRSFNNSIILLEEILSTGTERIET